MTELALRELKMNKLSEQKIFLLNRVEPSRHTGIPKN